MSSTLPQKGDAEGSFLLIPDEACEANMVETFYRTPLSADLQTICSTWYRRPPKQMDTELLIRDDRREVTKLKRRDIGIRGFGSRREATSRPESAQAVLMDGRTTT